VTSGVDAHGVKRDLIAQPEKIIANDVMYALGDSLFALLKGLARILGDDVIQSAERIMSLRVGLPQNGEIHIVSFPTEESFETNLITLRPVNEEVAKLVASGYPCDAEGNLALEYPFKLKELQ
jgi:hypothetical protein